MGLHKTNQPYWQSHIIIAEAMQQSRADGKVEDISGEVYRSLCSLRSASEVLRELGYAGIRETCIECFKAIDPQARPPSCSSCQRGCHAECLENLSNRQYRRRATSGQFECEWCIDFSRCVQCKNALDADDSNTYSCSICLRKTHLRCHTVPHSVMEAGGERPFAHLKQSIVCGGCLSRFGIREVVNCQTQGGKDYFLVRTDHPSPIHLTWVEDKLLSPSLRSSEGLLVSSPPQIEAIFSMHLPTQQMGLNIDRIQQLLVEYQLATTGRGFLFLTKWRHSQGGLVWEEARVFQQQRHHIIKFLHQLRMNLLSMHHELPPPILQRYFAHCITAYTLQHSIDLTAKPTFPKTEGSAGESVRAQHIYHIYSRKCKQFVNIKHTGEKAEAMCQLIRTIYFIDKSPLPVVILTDEAKINAWTACTLKQLPHLTILSLEGANAGIEEVVRHRLLTKHGKGRLFRFNVLVMPYQSLRAIGSLFDFRHALEGFSLMVMDEKMPPLARYYYTNVKIARIKFHKDQKPPAPTTTPTEKHEVTSSDVTSSQKKSSMTLSSSRNLKLFLEKCNFEGQRIQPRCFIDILYQEFCESFHLSHAALIAKLPNQLQRLIFLRHVLACGLNSFKKENIYERMVKLEPSCFSEPKEAALAKLQTYLSYFLAHVAKHRGYITPEIKQFFFFTLERRHIFKVINDHTRLKNYCQLFEKDPHLELILSPPSILVEKQEVTLWRWESRFDYYICQGVLSQGTGNLEAISEGRGDWKNNGQALPLRNYLCQALAITTFRLSFFCEFLKARVQAVLTALEKRFG